MVPIPIVAVQWEWMDSSWGSLRLSPCIDTQVSVHVS